MSKKIYSLGGDSPSKEDLDYIKTKNEEKAERTAMNLAARDKKYTKEAIDDYNHSLATEFDEKLENMVLPKGKVLIRLFRAPRVREGSNLYLPNTKTFVSENTGQLKVESMDDSGHKYLSRAVIVKAAPDLEDQYPQGTVIDLYMQSYKTIAQFWSPLNRDLESMEDSKNTENYFTVSENAINFIWKGYQTSPTKTT